MTNSDRNGKTRAEPEGTHDGVDGTMISLDVLMAALRLVSDQHIAERNLHREQAAPDDENIASSSPSHGRSMSASVSTADTSTIMTSTLRSGPEVVVMDPAAVSVLGQHMETAGFQNIEAEGGAKRNDSGDDGSSCMHQTSTRWYCISRGRAVGVFAGWPNTSPLVTGVPGAIFQRYPTFTTALMAFMEAAANGRVTIISV